MLPIEEIYLFNLLMVRCYLSLKAGGAGTKEPKFNTYVSAVMNDGFGDSETYLIMAKRII